MISSAEGFEFARAMRTPAGLLPRWRGASRLRQRVLGLTLLAAISLGVWAGVDRLAGQADHDRSPGRTVAAAAGPVAGSSAVGRGGRTFYVSPAGRDRWRGTSPAHPWKSVARVNRARLRPGDQVLFRGGAAFSGTPLDVLRSGSPGNWITYGAYGGGFPTIRGGVFLSSTAWIRLEGLRLIGGPQGIESSITGSGVHHLVITRNSISWVGIGINSPNRRDTDWLISSNVVFHTGDSGLILQGSRFTVSGNKILDTGLNAAIHYGKHGIYAKGPHLSILANELGRFHDEGISTRYDDAVIVGNAIHNGRGGIGYYRDSPGVGKTTILRNRIWHVGYGIYISPADAAGPTKEQFVISGNSITASGVTIDVPRSIKVRAR